jgi:hypothetical protein
MAKCSRVRWTDNLTVMRNVYRTFIEGPEGDKPLGRPRINCERRDDVNCTHVARGNGEEMGLYSSSL